MSKIIAKRLNILLVAWLLCIPLTSVSQVLLKPELPSATPSVCGTTIDFNFTFRFTTTPFDNANKFILEISDASGDFSGATDVGSVTGQNTNFGKIPATIRIPAGSYGTGYRVRVRSTSPAMTGPPSDPFSAYDIPSGQLVLNNFSDVYLCGSGGSAQMVLNTNTVAEYRWSLNGSFLQTTNQPNLTVTQEGAYTVEVFYGTCGRRVSTVSSLFRIDGAKAQIEKGVSEVSICGGDAHTFKADDINTKLTYKWYKDGKLVHTSNTGTYTTPTVGQFGIYRLEVETPAVAGNPSCTARSQDVELKQKTAASIRINQKNYTKTVWVPGETRQLEVEVIPAGSYTYEWYKLDATGTPQRINIGAGNTISVLSPGHGEYFVRVIDGSGACAFTKDSDRFVLVETKKLIPTIRRATDYKECAVDRTRLLTVGIKAQGADGIEYDLTTQQLSVLTYSWLKDGASAGPVTTNELDVTSYTENGFYELVVSAGPTLTGMKSNPLDVKLTVADPTISSSTGSNSLCSGGSIVYTVSDIVAGFTYKWFKDGTEITVPDPKTLNVNATGEYTLQISGFGCTKDLTPIKVVPFDDSAVKVTPSVKVVLVQGQATNITASGANSYQWLDEATGAVLSTTATLQVNKVGKYILVATVDSCEVRKTIEVVEQDDQIIVPNIVSPNTVDGINDTWQLSNRYAFQPSVRIAIYDSNGVQVLSTTEYKNDWPSESLGNQRIFYYQIIRDDKLVKSGSISVID